MNFRSILLPALVVILASGAQAQLQNHERLESNSPNWTLTTAGGSWILDSVNTTANFGLVDLLQNEASFSYSRAPITLGPGSYVVGARIMKSLDMVGAAPITMTVKGGAGTVLATTVLTTASQKADDWVQVPYANFTITTPDLITVELSNTDTQVIKQNYAFDAMTLGTVHSGDVVYYQSFGIWKGTHQRNPTYFVDEVAEQDSADGLITHLTSVSYLFWKGLTLTGLPAGDYSMQVRLRKPTGATARENQLDDMVGHVWTNGSKTRTVKFLVADQVFDEWMLTPPNEFKSAGPTDSFEFRFGNIWPNGTWKYNYDYDCLVVRRTSTDYYGKGCAGSKGVLNLKRLNAPTLGATLTMACSNTQVAFLGMGSGRTNVDLGIIGMTGCTMLTTMSATLPMTASIGDAIAMVPVPNNAALVGAVFQTQALAIDPGANALGMAASNAVEHKIGQ